jgi:MarR family transcriptional regulator, organic hydroperoxide resistance regulator
MRVSSSIVDDTAKHRKMLEVLEQFRILFKSVRRHYGAVQRRAGIGGAQIWALSHIANHPGIKPGELARALAIHPSTASNLVRDLETLKLAVRRRQRKDQRVVELCATSRGLQILKRAPRPLIGVLQQALSDLRLADLEILHHHVGKLVAKMKAKDVQARATPLSNIL